MKRLNISNLIKIVVMGICIIILAKDFITLFAGIITSNSISFTWYGFVVDMILMILFDIYYLELFGGNYE